MHTDDVVEYFRRQVQDELTDASGTDTYALFKHDEVLQYVYEAQNELCHLTAVISDTTTPEICHLAFVADQEFVPYHPAITNIRRARTQIVPRTMIIRHMHDMEQQVEDDYSLSGFHKGWEQARGQPKYLVLDYEPEQIRLAPIPSQDDEVRLAVHRLPICDVRNGANLEIPEQYRAQLVLWMKHLAYRKADSEIFDEDLADRYQTRFVQFAREVDTRNKVRGKRQFTTRYGGL